MSEIETTENVVTVQASELTVVQPSPQQLAEFQKRKAAGESYATLAAEVGMPWQKLCSILLRLPRFDGEPATAAAQLAPPPLVKLAERAHRQLPELMELIAEGHVNVMLVGPAGTGKTTLAKHAAKQLGRTFGVLSLSAGVTETHVFGRMLPQADGTWQYVESPFVRLYRNGGVFLFDELDAADGNVLVSVNAALANGFLCNPVNGEVVDRHPDTIIIAAANTWGRGGDAVYVGRNALDGATLDRFVLADLFVDYDRELEFDLCKAGLPTLQAADLYQWVGNLRDAIRVNRLRRIASTRLLVNGIKAMRRGKTLGTIKERYFKNWSADERTKANV